MNQKNIIYLLSKASLSTGVLRLPSDFWDWRGTGRDRSADESLCETALDICGVGTELKEKKNVPHQK